MSFGESFSVLTMQPRVIARGANQQIAVSVVRSVAVDVVDVFAPLHRSAQNSFRNLYMDGLRPCLSFRGTNSFVSVDIAANPDPLACFSLGDVATWFATTEMCDLQLATIRTWIKRLSVLIARQSNPFRSWIRTWAPLLKSGVSSGLQQMRSLFFRHCNGILLHGDGIA